MPLLYMFCQACKEWSSLLHTIVLYEKCYQVWFQKPIVTNFLLKHTKKGIELVPQRIDLQFPTIILKRLLTLNFQIVLQELSCVSIIFIYTTAVIFKILLSTGYVIQNLINSEIEFIFCHLNPYVEKYKVQQARISVPKTIKDFLFCV